MPRLPIDHSKTIIYKICCNDVSITDIYVGHTTDLIRRRQNHKDCCTNEKNKDYNSYKYQFIRENGMWDNWSLVPIEEYPCENVNQARIRERYWIETLKPELNKQIPTRSNEEWGKEYYQKNKEKIAEKHKQYHEQNKEKEKEYYEANKDKILEKKKEYRKNNKEKIAEKDKQRYENNKEIINEKKKKKFTCECGSFCRISDKAKHLKTKKHQEYLSAINENREESTP